MLFSLSFRRYEFQPYIYMNFIAYRGNHRQILAKLCESTDKFALKSKLSVSNNDAILTYWLVKNSIFTFYKRSSSTFKLLNCLNEMSLMSYKNTWMISLKKINWHNQNHVYFLFPKRVYIMVEEWMTFSDNVEFLLVLYC